MAGFFKAKKQNAIYVNRLWKSLIISLIILILMILPEVQFYSHHLNTFSLILQYLASQNSTEIKKKKNVFEPYFSRIIRHIVLFLFYFLYDFRFFVAEIYHTSRFTENNRYIASWKAIGRFPVLFLKCK